ncbi:diaminopimelate epimerase [Pseudotenacibaculum haliotis]|uniref:Diaminopimelate epimerase n=1 Tax=Pseudotenacibaculum haliotis TaxID=1862138 RepID=A0ABW5LPC3_9FLAO
MNINFFKYQGTGNDFVILDNRTNTFPKENNSLVASLCDRHFGVGADGLILLENDDSSDFKMVYYNADGNESTMCGNGGRCIVAFAKKLNLFENKTTFVAVDGLHHAEVDGDIVSLQMIDVDSVKVMEEAIFADTGSPHHVEIVDALDNYPVFEKGRKIRNEIYGKEGSNVNFVEQMNEDTFRIRTYERGVEDETLACGTGVTAAAIAMHKTQKTSSNQVNLLVEGGKLQVSFDVEDNRYTNVVLSGPAQLVFEGSIQI